MIHIFRELIKFCLTAMLWGIPVLLSWMNQNNHFLWLFVLSLLVTVGVLTHYEDLARIEAMNEPPIDVDDIPFEDE